MISSLRPSAARACRAVHRPTAIPASRRPPRTSRPLSDDKSPKDSIQNREAMNTESTEYAKSGSDSSAAQRPGAAFEPGRHDNDPVGEKDQAGKEVRTIHENATALHHCHETSSVAASTSEKGTTSENFWCSIY